MSFKIKLNRKVDFDLCLDIQKEAFTLWGLDRPTGPNFLGTRPSGSVCSPYLPFSSSTAGKRPAE